MTLCEYVRSYYPIKQRIQNRLSNPVQQVMEADQLPYDEILPVEGIYQKVVYLTDEDYITVTELLSFSDEDMKTMPDCELKDVWKVYMENIDITDFNVLEIMNSAKRYFEEREKRGEVVRHVYAGS